MDLATMRRKRAALHVDSVVLAPVDGGLWPGKVVPAMPGGGLAGVRPDPYLRAVELFELGELRVYNVGCLHDYCDLARRREAEATAVGSGKALARACAAAERYVREWGAAGQRAGLRAEAAQRGADESRDADEMQRGDDAKQSDSDESRGAKRGADSDEPSGKVHKKPKLYQDFVRTMKQLLVPAPRRKSSDLVIL